MDFLIKRDDLHDCRLAEGEIDPAGPGQAVLRVDTFGLTTNNITYAVFGEAMSYWDFFPAEEGWGRMPVWGFADVEDPGDTELDEGTRVFGYLPPSSRVVMMPQGVDEQGFFDASPHRSNLPSPYNRYTFTEAMPVYDPEREAELMLLWPLFYTSFLLDDFLGGEGMFGARVVVLSSASSKTALGAAFQLAQREGIEVVGLTSSERVDFVEGLSLYDRVVGYSEADSLPREPAVYVDVSGDGAVRAAVHERYGDDLRHSAVVGATHFEQLAPEEARSLPGPNPQFFFAPDQVRRRTADWGREGLDSRFAGAWGPFVEWASGWLEVVRREGGEEIRRTYLELLDGDADPSTGYALSP
jgi:uncharacterized protein DUF2855